MEVTSEMATAAKNKVQDQIINAAKDFVNNPDRAEAFIRSRIDKLYDFAIQYGKDIALDGIFNGDTEG
jgi:hypothetical protein